jgi:hypothetical protein
MKVEFVEIFNDVLEYEILSIKIKFHELQISISYNKKDLEFCKKIIKSYLFHPFSYSPNITIISNEKKLFFNNIDENDIDDFFSNNKNNNTIIIKYNGDEYGENAYNVNKFFIPYLVSPYKPDSYYLKKTIKKYTKK